MRQRRLLLPRQPRKNLLGPYPQRPLNPPKLPEHLKPQHPILRALPIQLIQAILQQRQRIRTPRASSHSTSSSAAPVV